MKQLVMILMLAALVGCSENVNIYDVDNLAISSSLIQDRTKQKVRLCGPDLKNICIENK